MDSRAREERARTVGWRALTDELYVVSFNEARFYLELVYTSGASCAIDNECHRVIDDIFDCCVVNLLDSDFSYSDLLDCMKSYAIEHGLAHLKVGEVCDTFVTLMTNTLSFCIPNYLTVVSLDILSNRGEGLYVLKPHRE